MVNDSGANVLYRNNGFPTTTLIVRPLSAAGFPVLLGATVELWLQGALAGSQLMDGGSGWCSQNAYGGHFASLQAEEVYTAIVRGPGLTTTTTTLKTGAHGSFETLSITVPSAPTHAPTLAPTGPTPLPTGPTPVPTLAPTTLLACVDTDVLLVFSCVFVLVGLSVLVLMTKMREQPFIAHVPASTRYSVVLLATYDIIVDMYFLEQNFGTGRLALRVYIVVVCIVPLFFNLAGGLAVVVRGKRQDNLDLDAMRTSPAFVGLVLLCAMSNPSVVVLLPWKRRRYIQSFPDSFAFGVACLGATLWEATPQLIAQSLVFQVRGEFEWSYLLAICGSSLQILFTLVFGLLFVLGVADKPTEQRSLEDEFARNATQHANLLDQEARESEGEMSSSDAIVSIQGDFSERRTI